MSTDELLLENRSMGWVSAATAPAWARTRIIEVRKAQLDKTAVPSPSREYCAAAEKRSLAARNLARTLFPVRRKCLEDRFVEAHGYDPFLTKIVALRQSAEISRDAVRFAARIAAEARDSRPDYLLNADEKYQRAMRRDAEARAIAQVEVAACRAKSAEGHRKAADFHCDQARNCRSIEQAKLHYDAADAHRRAADSLTEQTASDAHQTCLVARNWVTPAEGGQQ